MNVEQIKNRLAAINSEINRQKKWFDQAKKTIVTFEKRMADLQQEKTIFESLIQNAPKK